MRSMTVSCIGSTCGRELMIHRFMADKVMPLSQAVEGYELFDQMKVQKVVFEAQK
jgi:hypothetical protein